MQFEFDSLEKALGSLDGLLAKTTDADFMSKLDQVTRFGLRAGVIQNFEFSYELCWKFMKRWLEVNVGKSYVEGVSRQELFRLSSEHLLIENIEAWMDYHKGRNLTSHTYDEEVAEDVYNTATSFIHDAKRLLANLKNKR